MEQGTVNCPPNGRAYKQGCTPECSDSCVSSKPTALVLLVFDNLSTDGLKESIDLVIENVRDLLIEMGE